MKACLFAVSVLLGAILAVGSSPVAALSNCTQLNGSQYTSGHCTGTGGTQFMHAEQTCVYSTFNWVVQRGPSVGVGGYSSAGPCPTSATVFIVNRKLVQTTFP